MASTVSLRSKLRIGRVIATATSRTVRLTTIETRSPHELPRGITKVAVMLPAVANTIAIPMASFNAVMVA